MLLGDSAVESEHDYVSAGEAEVFRLQAGATGTAGVVHLYIDSRNQAKTVIAGIYSDSNGHPGALLGSGSLTAPKAGTWAAVPVTATALVTGGNYWLAILGEGGTLRYRDRSDGSCPSQSSAQDNLGALPGAWSTGTTYADCPVSGYVTGSSSSTVVEPTPPINPTPPTEPLPPIEPTPPVESAPTPPAAPTNRVAPAIAGTTTQSQMLSASTGTWTGSPTAYSYQWQDCNTSGAACTKISSATTSKYSLAAGDVGHTVRVVVTARNTGGSNSASSAQSHTVAAASTPPPAPPTAPTDSAAPVITGTATQNQKLSASTGTWTGSPTAYSYQWQDCNTSGTACTNVSSATSSQYTLTAGDVGDTVRVVVTASNAGGSNSATSAQSPAVAAASTPPPSSPPPSSATCTKTLSTSSNVASELAAAHAGDTVCLSAGSYRALTLDNINPSSGVTLEPASGASVTIAGITMELDSNLTISGFQFSSGVSVEQGATNLTFRGNRTSNTECGYFFYGYGSNTISHIQVLENTMENLNFHGEEGVCAGTGVVFIGNVANFTIDNNTFGPYIADHYTQTGGIEGLQENGNTFLGPSLRYEHGEEDHQNILQIFGESRNVEFSNNIMRNTGTNGGSLLFQEGQMKNVKVNNNLFDHDAEGYSVQIYPVEELEFTHNTVIGSHWGVYFRAAEPRDESHGDDYNVTDNIFVENDKSGGTPDVAEYGCSSSCTFDYNVSSDNSATGSHSVDNWKPQWAEATPTFFQPVGLPFEAGYQQGG